MQVLVPERWGLKAISAVRDTSANITACWEITVWTNKTARWNTEGERALWADMGFLKNLVFNLDLNASELSAETLDEQSQCYS